MVVRKLGGRQALAKSRLPRPQYPQGESPPILERLDRDRDFQHRIATVTSP